MPHNHLTEDCSPEGGGPWMLRIVGFWAWAKRAKVVIYDVDIFDASLSLVPRKLRGNQHLVEEQPVPDICEDVEPEEGLDVEFGAQVLRGPRGAGDSWTVTDAE